MDFGFDDMDFDDSMWDDGLPCPPLEDYAFNFSNGQLDDDLLFEDKSSCESGRGKLSIRCGNHGKGKELSVVKAAFLQQETNKKRKFMDDDYDSKFEATRRKLREGYKQFEEAKLQRKIQVIDVQKPQPRCTKRKPTFRQKLMATGTRKTKNKFSFSALASCNYVAPMVEWTNNHFRTLARLITKHARLYTEMTAAETIIYQR